MRMYRRQGKISKCKTQTVSETLLNRLNDPISLPARGTLVVAIFKKADRSIDKPLDVVTATDRDGEFVGAK